MGLWDPSQIQYPNPTSGPVGLMSGINSGLNAAQITAQTQREKQMADAQQQEIARGKMSDSLNLMKASWVPKDYKLALYNQNVKPYFQGTGMQLPDLQEWPDYADKASKEISDLVTNAPKMNGGKGLHPSDMQLMMGQILSKYAPADREKAQPMVDAVKMQVAHEEKMAEIKQRGDFTLGLKTNQLNQKRLADLGKALDPASYRTGQFGNIFGVQLRSERLQALGSAYQGGNLDPRQINELAIGLNSMLSGSNVAASEQTKGLVPQSLVGNATKMYEWLRNNPTGTNQQAFVNRMMDTVGREKAVAQSQLKRAKYSKIAPYEDLRLSNPEGFNGTLASQGVDPAEYQQWVLKGRPELSVSGEPQAAPTSQPANGGGQPKPRTVTQNGMTYTLNDQTGQYE